MYFSFLSRIKCPKNVAFVLIVQVTFGTLNGKICVLYNSGLSIALVVKVKESRNRPGVAQNVPGSLGSQISLYSAHEGGEVVSLTHRPPLPPRMFLVLIFTRGLFDPRAMVWSEGNMSLKNPVTVVLAVEWNNIDWRKPKISEENLSN